MGSEIEGGILDIHFGNKTDVDLCRIILVEKNTSNPSWVYHLCNLWLKKWPDCSNHFKKSDWIHFTISKVATEDFPVLLAPSDSMLPLEVFARRYLVEYPSRKIWLSEAEAWLPSDGLKFYTDGSLLEGRAGSGVFSEELDLKASFALGTFATVFQAEIYAIMACSVYCLRECMTGKRSAFARTVGPLYWRSHTVSSRLVLQCRNSLQGLFLFIIVFNCFEFLVIVV
jgi:hypothetical protein